MKIGSCERECHTRSLGTYRTVNQRYKLCHSGIQDMPVLKPGSTDVFVLFIDDKINVT